MNRNKRKRADPANPIKLRHPFNVHATRPTSMSLSQPSVDIASVFAKPDLVVPTTPPINDTDYAIDLLRKLNSDSVQTLQNSDVNGMRAVPSPAITPPPQPPPALPHIQLRWCDPHAAIDTPLRLEWLRDRIMFIDNHLAWKYGRVNLSAAELRSRLSEAASTTTPTVNTRLEPDGYSQYSVVCDIGIRQSLLACGDEMDALDLCNNRIWNCVRNKTCDPWDLVIAKKPRAAVAVSRALDKLACIHHDTGYAMPCWSQMMSDDRNSTFHFVDLAAGPGGFTEYFFRRAASRCRGFVFTATGELDMKWSGFCEGVRDCAATQTEAYYGHALSDHDGDLTVPQSISDFVQYVMVQTDNKGVDIATADGGFDFSGIEAFQEPSMNRLVLCECAIALGVLATGGSAVIKIFDVTCDFMIHLVLYMIQFFSKWTIHKPLASRPMSAERYFILSQLRAWSCSLERVYAVEILIGIAKRLAFPGSDCVDRRALRPSRSDDSVAITTTGCIFRNDEIPAAFTRALRGLNTGHDTRRLGYIQRGLWFVKNNILPQVKIDRNIYVDSERYYRSVDRFLAPAAATAVVHLSHVELSALSVCIRRSLLGGDESPDIDPVLALVNTPRKLSHMTEIMRDDARPRSECATNGEKLYWASPAGRRAVIWKAGPHYSILMVGAGNEIRCMLVSKDECKWNLPTHIVLDALVYSSCRVVILDALSLPNDMRLFLTNQAGRRLAIEKFMSRCVDTRISLAHEVVSHFSQLDSDVYFYDTSRRSWMKTFAAENSKTE